MKTQEREIPASNFSVPGIALGEKMFASATSNLESATIVERGDAATGREQICFVSSKRTPTVFLIFEDAEVGYSFCLFSESKDWKGKEKCLVSEQIASTTSTASGLRLGLSPNRVIAILGPPSVRRKDELFYSLHVNKKYSEKDLKQFRANLPNLCDELLCKDYQTYDWGVSSI